MKKTLAFLSALIMAAVSIPVSAISAEDFAKGDVDMDGAVTGRDAAIVSQYADGVLKMELNEEQLELADMNGDGNVDAVDAALIAEIQTRELWDITGKLHWSGVRVPDPSTELNFSIILKIILRNKIREIDTTYQGFSAYTEYETWADVNLDGEINQDDLEIAAQGYAYTATYMPVFEEGKFYLLKASDNMKEGIGYGYNKDGTPMSFDEAIEKAVNSYFDVDGDGVLSISDASAILSTYANSMSGNGIYKASAENDIADVNGDGIVDISDATLILKINAYDAAGLL